MKKISNKYILCFFILILIIFFNPSKVGAVSYESDFIEIEKAITLETDEFEMNLEVTYFNDGISKKPSSIVGDAKQKIDETYYYHYILYYYDDNKLKIGAKDGYSGIYTDIDLDVTLGSYFYSSLELKNMYDNKELTDIKYYKIFIEPSNEDVVNDYLNNNKKINENGLDDITDFNTIPMTIIEGESLSEVDNEDSSHYVQHSNEYYDYVIYDYDIDMVVNENNTFDITENLTTYFNVPKHGIYRKIPLRNTIERLDGTTSKNRAKISNISVSEDYKISNENGYRVIKIGDSNKTITGRHKYTIKYNYSIGKDPLKNSDEFYYNLIGDQWDTNINNVSFKIEMPKSFEKTNLGFSSGNVGSVDNSNVEYEVNGNIITGTTKNILNPGEPVTVRLTLPEGYFVAKNNLDMFYIYVMVLCLAFVLIADVLWSKYGKDDEVIETVEFYPPEGYNSAEVGFLYNGSADTKEIISLLIYLANQGYLKIEETEEKSLFSKSKGFKITKIKEYDGNNECEKIFFDGLFKCSSTQNIVTKSDLYDEFYVTLDKIKSKMNSKKNKREIFEKSSSGKGKYLIMMIIAIFCLITIKPIIDYGEIGNLLIALVFSRNRIFFFDWKSYRFNKRP